MRDADALVSLANGASRIRVLVFDNSAERRAKLAVLLATDDDIEVVGRVGDAAAAVRAAERLRPNVITMDLRMAWLEGVAATRQIMRECPTPIVVVGASGAQAEQALATEALDAGVLAVMATPLPTSDSEAQTRELCRLIKSMAQVRVVRRRAEPIGAAIDGLAAPAALQARPPQIVAIGASTGGPQALGEILPSLPAGFAAPVVVVQHIAAGFLSGLVDWLRPSCALPIEVAQPDQPLDRPGIYLAPPGRHLIVRDRRLALTDDPPVSSHRPSATVLFQSVAHEYGSAAIGVLLTGMGDDGATGLQDLARAGATTVAQDKTTCAVFGMPAVAIALGVVHYVLPVGSIAPCLLQRMRQKAPSARP